MTVNMREGIPEGVIVMWSGALDDVPEGWTLCDGTDGAPDLTGRFIKSVPDSATDPGTTGGSSSHSHAVNSHSHTVDSHTHTVDREPSSTISFLEGSGTSYGAASDTHTHYETAETSPGTDSVSPGTDSKNHEPPYYELAFIMKL